MVFKDQNGCNWENKRLILCEEAAEVMKFWLTRHVSIEQSKLSRRSTLHVCYWTPRIGQLSDCAGLLFRIFSQSSITALIVYVAVDVAVTSTTMLLSDWRQSPGGTSSTGPSLISCLFSCFAPVVIGLCNHCVQLYRNKVQCEMRWN